MRVTVEGQVVQLDTNAVLGVGGEATVYRRGDKAFKIYHPVDPKLPPAERAAEAKLLEQKLEKLSCFPTCLPDVVVAPEALVFDKKKQAIGYVMPAIDGAFEIASLTKRSFRAGAISNDRVLRIFGRFAEGLAELHRAGVVVGDLNDGNVLVTGDRVRFIDVDSMQFGRFPCPVAHERYLDPRLYGADLSRTPSFGPDNDWYSFWVLLFSSLMYVHPFGGVHPTVPTLLRRAEAGLSVLSSDVKRPKAAADPRVLPDPLRNVFEACFERGARPVFDPVLVTPWAACRCGVEHARPVCPACASRGTISARPVVRHNGACRVTQLFTTEGRILTARLEGKLRWAAEEHKCVVREDGRAVAPALGPDVAYAIGGNETWANAPGGLLRADRDSGLWRSYGSTAAVAPWSGGCTRVADDWLIEETTGERIGPVLAGTTSIFGGEKLGFGFYRAGLVTKYFVFRPGRAGLTFVELPPIRGRVRGAYAAFDDRTIVFSLVTDHGGAIWSHLYVVGADGRVIATAVSKPDESRVLAAPRARCVLGGRVVTATDDGLVSLTIDAKAGTITEGTLFEDTEPFVSADVTLVPTPDGAIHVVTNTDIKTLALG